MIRVKVKLFGAPSQALERKEFTFDLEGDATVQAVVDKLPIQDKNYLYTVREGIRLNSESKLNDGDELIVFPPITGG